MTSICWPYMKICLLLCEVSRTKFHTFFTNRSSFCTSLPCYDITAKTVKERIRNQTKSVKFVTGEDGHAGVGK